MGSQTPFILKCENLIEKFMSVILYDWIDNNSILSHCQFYHTDFFLWLHIGTQIYHGLNKMHNVLSWFGTTPFFSSRLLRYNKQSNTVQWGFFSCISCTYPNFSTQLRYICKKDFFKETFVLHVSHMSYSILTQYQLHQNHTCMYYIIIR